MQRNISSLLILLLLLSCSQKEKSDSAIAKTIEKGCNGKEACIVDMKKIINEDWDKMYVFKVGVPIEKINQVMGFEYPYFEDIANRVIFTRGNKIVSHEDEFPGVESTKNGALVFNIGDSVDFKIFLPSETFFTVRKVDFSKGSYFELTQTK